MKRLTIQVRLTAWYFLSLAIIVALFAGSSWIAMKASMYHSIDRDLRYRVESVVPYIESHSLSTQEQFSKVFAASSDSSIVGVFVQITNEQSSKIYESDLLLAHKVPVLPPGPSDGSVAITTVGNRGWPVRVASKHLVVGGASLTVHIVEPLRDLLESLREFGLYLTLLIPIALLLTTTAGYWLSRSALAPVEQIRKEAESIDPADLTARLRVPPTEDELAKLAQTLNAMLARIESAFQAIERFTADASHELRAPLAMILTAGEVSLRRERTKEELADVLHKIVREARHMSNLIENLLDLARGDARRRQTEIVPVDLAGMLRDLLTELTPAAVKKGLSLTATVPDDAVRVLGEATELRRLFLILADNAIKYTEAGSVHLALGSEGGRVHITVSDTGIGIEESAMPHVFERFWRADKVRSRTEGGVGVGLSLALQIVQRNGGTLSVESEFGKGSSFTVQLPALGASQIS
ncbi:MAG: ATP-binding protein [Terracidiphilus sp.]|nr:ATP-binding protein [Terracidiphilus sp.]MDR3776114.1 ATP-binding protein [Terracidiphilus sp.]